MIELEHLQVQLPGMHLIEASAGTGKTYAIALLYLRILVELNLTPEQILVVTYTEAATKELRGRIRTRIREALEVIDGAVTDDLLLSDLCNNKNGKWGVTRDVRNRLNRALTSFDTASIFTIHGFCRRALQEFAFESGSRFDTELVTDQTDLLGEVVTDFWRRSFFGVSAPLLTAILKKNYSVASLKTFVREMVGKPNLKIIPEYCSDQIAELDAVTAALFCRIQQQWQERREEITVLISSDKGLSRSEKQYREDLLPDLFQQIDGFVAGCNPFALPRDFNKLCSSGIRKGTKGKGASPTHPVFELCEELQQKVQQRLLGFLGELILYCNGQLPLRKQQNNIRFFDDLLNDLHQALCNENGTSYAIKLRSRYQAALIDEFQDTDPVQYHIFRKIYAGTPLPLFLIGDPKQAIYSFRGADIFAYMQAAKDVAKEQRFTLTSNWRSTPNLLAAFNILFSSEKKPFIYEQIQYHPVAPGRESGTMLSDATATAAPLQICLMPSEELTVTKANRLVPEHVAAEISRLLHEGAAGRALIGDQPVLPGDIAVIVRNHRQAGSIRDALSLLGIPCVLRSNMTIFETDEAQELCLLLRALQNPGNESAVRAALVTDLLGRSGSDIAVLLDDEPAWEQCLAQFREFHQLWHDKGFMVMARMLLSLEGVRGRLLRYPDGERRLTNLLHCFEVIHGKAHQQGIGMDGLISWFSEQVSVGEKAEEHEIRLETDEKAVRIVTVHISKGLEYPVVFCPFLWTGIIGNDGLVTFHDDDGMVKDFGSSAFTDHKQKADTEQLAESLRLLYVAITRAKYRCYLFAGKVISKSEKSRPETSPMAYLLHASMATRESEQLITSLAEEYAGLTADTVQKQLEELAVASVDKITVTPLSADVPVGQPWHFQEGEQKPFRSRPFGGSISHDWRVSSFSSFTSHDARITEFPDRDESLTDVAEITPKVDDRSGNKSIFLFPRGAQAGIFMHAIFEELDFTDASPQTIAKLAATCLDRYGFDAGWLPAVVEMVTNVITTPLSDEDSSFCLSDLKQGSWLTELEFFFPLSFITSDALRSALTEYAAHYQPVNLTAVLASLQFKPTVGMIRGFMDMVFEHGGRYYLLDWKSNHLGYCQEEYSQEAMKREMEKNLYPFQYLLYTVALNRYLALRIRNYDYRQHFGGVRYLFIRGMSPHHGVFRDLPPVELIHALTVLLHTSERRLP